MEALAGTVSDFDPAAAAAYQRRMNLPSPKPMPRVPDSYARDNVYSILTEIASSSWDSIYENASRPRRRLPAHAGFAASPTAARRPARAAAKATAPAPPPRPLTRRPERPPSPARSATWARRAARTAVRTFEAFRKWIAPEGAVRLL